MLEGKKFFEHFSQPTPDNEEKNNEATMGSGTSKESAGDSLDTVNADIASLQEEFDSRDIGAIEYSDRMLASLAQRQDLLSRSRPSNQEIVRALSTKYPTLGSILGDGEVLGYGDFKKIETQNPLSSLSEEAKSMRKLVKESAGTSFAYHPFLHALFMVWQIGASREWRISHGCDYKYNFEQLKSLRKSWQMIDSLSGVPAKAKVLPALLILSSIAENTLTRDIQSLREGSKAILPNAEEEFWGSHLFGKPRNEGILFCRHYTSEVRQKADKLAKELYGARAARALTIYDALFRVPFPSDLRKEEISQQVRDITLEIIEPLLRGSVHTAEFRLNKAAQRYSDFSHTKGPDALAPIRGSFDTQAIASRSARSRKESIGAMPLTSEIGKGERIEGTKKGMHWKHKSVEQRDRETRETLDVLRSIDKHLFFNLLSMQNPPYFQFVYLMTLKSIEERYGNIMGIQIYINQKQNMILQGFHYAPKRLVRRIMAAQQYQEKVQHYTGQDQSHLFPRVVEGGALLDIGALEACTPEEIRTRIIDFFSSDKAKWLPPNTCENIIKAFKETDISFAVKEQKKADAFILPREEEQQKIIERFTALYHHVIISRTRRTSMIRSHQESEYSVTYILGFIPAGKRRTKGAKEACSTAEGIDRPRIASLRRYYSHDFNLITTMGFNKVPTSHFENQLLLKSTALDMGRYDEFGHKQVPALIQEYLRRTSGDKD